MIVIHGKTANIKLTHTMLDHGPRILSIETHIVNYRSPNGKNTIAGDYMVKTIQTIWPFAYRKNSHEDPSFERLYQMMIYRIEYPDRMFLF